MKSHPTPVSVIEGLLEVLESCVGQPYSASPVHDTDNRSPLDLMRIGYMVKSTLQYEGWVPPGLSVSVEDAILTVRFFDDGEEVRLNGAPDVDFW